MLVVFFFPDISKVSSLAPGVALRLCFSDDVLMCPIASQAVEAVLGVKTTNDRGDVRYPIKVSM